MAERKFAIRFSVEDMEKVRAALKGMGSDGAGALRAIEAGSRTASPQLKAVDVAAKEVRQTFDDWANRIPVIGGALQALGPIGTTVAAGFAGIAFGLSGLSNASRQAIQDIGNLKDAADAANLGVEDLQALRGAGMMAGIGRPEMDTMLATLAANSARASEGFGRMKAALDRVNPELSAQLAITTSQSERLDILAQATQQAATYNDKLNISIAAFGNNGGKMVQMLDEQGAAMDTWTERAIRAGIVLDENLVAAVDAMGDRMEAARARTEVAVQRLVVTMAPFEEWKERMLANQAAGWTEALDGLNAVEDRLTYTLLAQANRFQRNIDLGNDWFGIAASQLKEINAELQRRYEEDAAAEARSRSEGMRAILADPSMNPADIAAAEERARARKKATDDAAEAAKKAEEAARLRASQEREAIEIRASLGNWTSKLAAEEERLNTLVKAGVLSREDANASLANTRAELDGTAAAAERWTGMLQAAETPIERAERALAEFDAEVAKFGDLVGVNEDAVRAGLVDVLEEARRAAVAATPAMQAVARAREAIARHAEASMSDEQKVAAYTKSMHDLARAGAETGFTWEEAEKAIKAYRAELEKTTDAQKESTFEIRFASEVLGDILDENMNSLEDLGRVALRVFRQMAIEWMMTNQKMASSQGFFEWMGNVFASSFGGGPGPTQTVSPDASAGAGWGIYHTGGVIGSTPVPTRWASSGIFAGAPRMHRGGELRPGERPIIAEDGERMLSRVDNARIVRAIEAGGGGAANVEVHFHGDFESKPEVRQSRGTDGGTRIDVYARKAVAAAIADGAADKAMENRFGLKRAVGV